ncbi:murein DD-endopeptidase MepM/ murein hydrolase activator NlpD [Sedimentibacter acidaminivorans]|uniref:Murein DD-endopeptidase MepM/ murein hydrolase activator NlpD n=1 Tax=Sedimentibacter acidaminivorans TaxID=913099 RepID=A0ABS4G950_9FIRM|nr:peptidoglycan DD-metalloendopeptidase family protein [Sedimentibacter acidaminivorans]MBP1924199.1 murein DD-endopeptidase MepM/ murein hydrolase activator NlpD [Sedimentibacter acidaminivorans]
MFKKCVLFILSMVLMLGTIFPVGVGGSIADLQQKQKSIENKIKEYKQQANVLKNEKNTVQAEINKLDSQMNVMNLEIEGYELQKQELDMQIAAKEQDIVRLTKEIEENNIALEERLRTMYKKGTAGYLEVILNSEDLMDALTRVDMIQLIVKSDVDLLKSIESQKKQVEEIQVSLEDERTQVVVIQENVLAKKGQVLKASQEKLSYMSGLEKDIKQIQYLEAQEEAQAAQIEKDILAAQREVEYAGGEMLWPAPGNYRITSQYGKRSDPITGVWSSHGGTDIATPYGSSIISVNDGVVIFAGWHYSYGNYVIVDHGGGIATVYAHNSKLLVTKGQAVARGEKIAQAGSTGYSTGNHLHFEVRINGVRTDPMKYLK